MIQGDPLQKKMDNDFCKTRGTLALLNYTGEYRKL